VFVWRSSCPLSAVLKPEQVIARNVKPPPLPKNMTDEEAMLGGVMPADHHSIFLYNKNTRSKERICLWCRTHYRLGVMAEAQLHAGDAVWQSISCQHVHGTLEAAAQDGRLHIHSNSQEWVWL